MALSALVLSDYSIIHLSNFMIKIYDENLNRTEYILEML